MIQRFYCPFIMILWFLTMLLSRLEILQEQVLFPRGLQRDLQPVPLLQQATVTIEEDTPGEEEVPEEEDLIEEEARLLQLADEGRVLTTLSTNLTTIILMMPSIILSKVLNGIFTVAFNVRQAKVFLILDTAVSLTQDILFKSQE